MGRFILSGLAAAAMMIGFSIIDKGLLSVLIDNFAVGLFGQSELLVSVRVATAFLLIVAGLVAIAALLVRDGSRSAVVKRRVLVRAIINGVVFFIILLGLGAIVGYIEGWELNRWVAAQLFFSGLLAGAVGFGELIQRYKDNPHHLMASSPSAIYVCVNVAAGIGALALVKHFEVFSAGPNKGIYETLLAGFGAIAFFRTSFFTAKVGDADVGIGPATLLKSLLDSSDMMTDREQAVVRGETMSNIMPDIDFDKAKATLPSLCFTLVEGSNPDQQQAVGKQIAKLESNELISDKAKSMILGAYLIRQVGATVLAQAVDTLGDEIKKPSQIAPGPEMETVSNSTLNDQVPDYNI